MRNTRPRSAAVDPRAFPGTTCTPTSRTSLGRRLSIGSEMPHVYRSAVPVWIPVLVSGSVAEIVFPGVPVKVEETGVTLLNSLGAPATMLDSPRGTSMKGTRSVWWSAGSPAAGVATVVPRTLTTPPRPTATLSPLPLHAQPLADHV